MRKLVFSLSEVEADALIDLVCGLDSSLKSGCPLDRAANKLDEQKAKQGSPWERCTSCKGSGWIETLSIEAESLTQTLDSR